jgi:hypothetical protein
MKNILEQHGRPSTLLSRQNKSFCFLIVLASSALLFVFLYTATAKLLDLERFVSTIDESFLLKGYGKILSWAVPVIELFLAALLFFPGSRQLGFWLSAMLLVFFTLYIGVMLLSGNKLPCSCGGVVSKLSWAQHLVFNFVLIVLSVLGIILNKKYCNNVPRNQGYRVS